MTVPVAVPHPGLGSGHTAPSGFGRAGRPCWSRSRPAHGIVPTGPIWTPPHILPARADPPPPCSDHGWLTGDSSNPGRWNTLWPCRPSSTDTRVSGVVPPGACSGHAFAYTVAAPDSCTWGRALALCCDFLVRTSCWLRNGLAVWLVVRSTRSIELISVSYWRSLYSTNPSTGGATHALPLGLHPGESILARRQALPLAVTDASTPSAWNGMIDPLLPTGVYGGPSPASWGHWHFGCVPPVVSSLISGSLGPSGGHHHSLAPHVLTPLGLRLASGPCPGLPLWAQPDVFWSDHRPRLGHLCGRRPRAPTPSRLGLIGESSHTLVRS